MTETISISISVDPAAAAWLDEATRCLLLVGELVPCPPDLIEIVNRLGDAAACFNLKTPPAARAGEHRIIFEPSKAVRDLVAAVRAREGVGEFVAECHGIPSENEPASVAHSLTASSPDQDTELQGADQS